MKTSHLRVTARILSLLHLTGLILFILSAAPAISQAEEMDLCIIHLNDVHGYLLPYEDKSLTEPPGKVGGAAFIAAKIEEIKKAHKGSWLLLDAGDIAQGTPISNEFRGEPVIEIMNRIGVQATTLGNHEFDWGQDTLRKMLSREKFPCICANLLDTETGRLAKFIKEPYHIFTVNGIRIGIIGITTPETPRMSFEYHVKGLKFEEPEKVLPAYIKELREKGVQLVGVLSHYGIDGDKKMAERVPGIDFIVGGHTHKALKDPLIVNNTIIVQAGAYGMYVGELNLRVDRSTGKIVMYTEKNELHPIIDDHIKPDPAVAAIVDKYYLRLKPIMEEVVGQSGEDIGKSPKPGSGDTPIGDVITDFLRVYSKTEIFFCNSGGLRSPIPKGPITRDSIYRVLPFDDYIVTMDLTGREALDIIMHGTSSEKMIQVSGITFSLYPSRSGSERIVDVKVGDQPLDPDKTYKVGTINYLSRGGDGYTTFSKGRNVVNDPELIRDVVCRVIKVRKTIEVPQEKRIMIVGEPKKP